MVTDQPQKMTLKSLNCNKKTQKGFQQPIGMDFSELAQPMYATICHNDFWIFFWLSTFLSHSPLGVLRGRDGGFSGVCDAREPVSAAKSCELRIKWTQHRGFRGALPWLLVPSLIPPLQRLVV
jgi:hypothetical protein